MIAYRNTSRPTADILSPAEVIELDVNFRLNRVLMPFSTDLWHFYSIRRSEFAEASTQNISQSCTNLEYLRSRGGTNVMSMLNCPFRMDV